MKERTERMGGKFSVKSRKDEGTEVKVTIRMERKLNA